jgi:Amidase
LGVWSWGRTWRLADVRFGVTAAATATACANVTLSSTEVEPAMASESSDLCFMSARELQSLIRTRKLSAHESMAGHLQQINRVNPKINAIVAKSGDDKCLALADEADRRLARGEKVGPLHGLPIAFKDTEAA